MNTYKVSSSVWSEEKGNHIAEVYIKDQPSEEEAERMAKYYYIDKGFCFFGALKIIKI
jgi:hypothetical protein